MIEIKSSGGGSVAVPTLQQVTTQGATTTVPMQVTGANGTCAVGSTGISTTDTNSNITTVEPTQIYSQTAAGGSQAIVTPNTANNNVITWPDASGQVQLSGQGVNQAITTVTADIFLSTSNYTVLVSTSTGNINILLSNITTVGTIFNIKKIAGTYSVLVSGNLMTIDGVTNTTINTLNESLTVQYAGSGAWYII